MSEVRKSLKSLDWWRWPRFGGQQNTLQEVAEACRSTLFSNRQPGQARRTDVVSNEAQWNAAYDRFDRGIGRMRVIGMDTEGICMANYLNKSEAYSKLRAGMCATAKRHAQREDPVLLQLSNFSGDTVLVQLSKFDKLPPSLASLLANKEIVKVGVAIGADAVELEESFGVPVNAWLDLRFIVNACRANVLGSISPRSSGLKAQAEAAFGASVLPYAGRADQTNRLVRVSYSFWCADRLAGWQKEYAAFDSQVSVDIVGAILGATLGFDGLQGVGSRAQAHSWFAKRLLPHLQPSLNIHFDFNALRSKGGRVALADIDPESCELDGGVLRGHCPNSSLKQRQIEALRTYYLETLKRSRRSQDGKIAKFPDALEEVIKSGGRLPAFVRSASRALAAGRPFDADETPPPGSFTDMVDVLLHWLDAIKRRHVKSGDRTDGPFRLSLDKIKEAFADEKRVWQAAGPVLCAQLDVLNVGERVLALEMSAADVGRVRVKAPRTRPTVQKPDVQIDPESFYGVSGVIGWLQAAERQHPELAVTADYVAVVENGRVPCARADGAAASVALVNERQPLSDEVDDGDDDVECAADEINMDVLSHELVVKSAVADLAPGQMMADYFGDDASPSSTALAAPADKAGDGSEASFDPFAEYFIEEEYEDSLDAVRNPDPDERWIRVKLTVVCCWTCGEAEGRRLVWEPIVPLSYVKIYEHLIDCFCNYARLCVRCGEVWRAQQLSTMVELAYVFDASVETPEFAIKPRVEQAWSAVDRLMEELQQVTVDQPIESFGGGRRAWVEQMTDDLEVLDDWLTGERDELWAKYEHADMEDVCGVHDGAFYGADDCFSRQRRSFAVSKDEQTRSLAVLRRVRGLLAAHALRRTAVHHHEYKVLSCMDFNAVDLELVYRRRFRQAMGRGGYLPEDFCEAHGCLPARVAPSFETRKPLVDGQSWQHLEKEESDEVEKESRRIDRIMSTQPKQQEEVLVEAPPAFPFQANQQQEPDAEPDPFYYHEDLEEVGKQISAEREAKRLAAANADLPQSLVAGLGGFGRGKPIDGRAGGTAAAIGERLASHSTSETATAAAAVELSDRRRRLDSAITAVDEVAGQVRRLDDEPTVSHTSVPPSTERAVVSSNAPCVNSRARGGIASRGRGFKRLAASPSAPSVDLGYRDVAVNVVAASDSSSEEARSLSPRIPGPPSIRERIDGRSGEASIVNVAEQSPAAVRPMGRGMGVFSNYARQL